MNPTDLQPVLRWCLESILAEVGPTIERFVENNHHVLRRIKDHQWHALLSEVVVASTVQSIQKFLHEQGTRSTRQEWRQTVRLTFVDQDKPEPLWLALIKLLNWVRQEGSPPQQRITALQQDLAVMCYDAGIQVDVALKPEMVELELMRMVIDQLVAKVEEKRVEHGEEVKLL